MMSEIDDLLESELRSLPAKPSDEAKQSEKKRYSELMSAAAARALSEALRGQGLDGTLPAPNRSIHGVADGRSATPSQSGAERRMDGGLGAKKVDVTWSTEESGLLLGLSIKTINFKDRRSGNYQKNLTNRRNDMLFESTTLHRRFPFATLGGFFFLDAGADSDGTDKRESTFINAHRRLKMFTGRDDPAGRPEQYERLFLVTVDACPSEVTCRVYRAGEPNVVIGFGEALGDLIEIVAERSPDFYEIVQRKLVKVNSRR